MSRLSCYVKFLFVLGLIFAVQIFLAYKSFRLSSLDVTSISQPVQEAREKPLPCDVSKNKDVVSAVQRAKSTECKKQILDIACAIRNDTFYPKWLPNTCPTGGQVKNRYLGCFKDLHDDRILSGYYVVLKATNTPRKCIHICLQSGFMYAGTQYSNECFCGNDRPLEELRLSDNSCIMRCSGDASLSCGGYYTVAVYETGILKFVPQVAESVHVVEEVRKPVRLAFLLTLNGRAIRQVYRLIKSLYRSDHFYYIHIDSRQRYMYRELLALEPKYSNIRLARKRYSTIWGGASLLTMLLQSMEDLLHSNSHWDYIINLSESDFPVKTVDQLVKFLSINEGRNFVKSHGRETQRFIQKQGLDKTFVECDTHMWRIGDRELPENIQIDGGSDWLGMSRKFVTHLIENGANDELIQGLLVIFKQTLLPAESFFHTVLRNSEFCNTYVDNNLHITNWRRKLGCKCQYKHVVDWCGCSPNDFKAGDWDRLENTASKDIFFARKFEASIDHAIIVKLEEWLFGPYPPSLINLHSYWQNVYHHFDDRNENRDGILSVSTSIIQQQGVKLQYVPGNILEVTSYFENDNYRGFLVLHEGSLKEDVIELEVFVRPNQTGQISKTSVLSKRIQILEVSSEFDQKEQTSRNYAKTLGPHSEPHLMLKLLGNPGDISYNFTIVWYEPSGKLEDISEMYIEDASTTSINFAKPVLEAPLSYGIWLVKVLHKKSLIGLCKFLVVPDITAGPLVKGELESIHSLVESFYTVRAVCIAEGANFGELPRCSDTSWSSKAPDPKSDISFHHPTSNVQS